MGKRRDRWASSSSSEDENDNDDGKKISTKSQRSNAGGGKEREAPKEDKPHIAASDRKHPPSSSYVESNQQTKPLSLPLHSPLWHGSRKVYDCYERVRKVSEGTYGVVWMARDVTTNETVALKQIKFILDEDVGMSSSSIASSASHAKHQQRVRREGFPITALREINVLLALSHESIVTVKEMVVGDSPDQVFMVMDYYEFDLKVGINNFDGPLFQGELKGIMRQVLSATAYLHSQWYLHRDLKPSNILVHRSGRIALADFGLARYEPAVFFRFIRKREKEKVW
jgi:cell division cycle 2-like protein